MRKIAANMLFGLTTSPLKNSYLVLNDDGSIIDIIDTGGQIPEIASLEYYNGILVPGFIVNYNQLTDGQFQPPYYYWNIGIQALVTNQPNNRFAKPEIIAKPNIDGLLSPCNIIHQLSEKQETDGIQAFQQLLEKVILLPAIKFNLQHKYGSFAPGTKPGVILISPFNFKTYRVNANSIIRRLI